MFDWNRFLFERILGLVNKSQLLDNMGVFFAEYLPYFLVLALIVFIIARPDSRKKWLAFAEIGLTLILARGLATEIIQYFYTSPRPFAVYGFTPLIPESGNSLPSGHAAFMFALAMALWFLDKKWGAWFMLFAVLNGVARVFVGVHWPLDILAGAAVGILSALAVHALVREKKKLPLLSGTTPAE